MPWPWVWPSPLSRWCSSPCGKATGRIRRRNGSPLAWYWKQREFFLVGGYATVLGAIGLLMALSGYPDWVPLVSGAVTGAGMLLGILTTLLLVRREPAAATSAA